MVESLDIDWFFLDNNYNIVFIASGGGRIPSSVSIKEHDILSDYFKQSVNLSNRYFISKQVNEILGIYEDEKLNKAILDFIVYAKKGLYCFDKTTINKPYDSNYHLVTTPCERINFFSLPKDIQTILIKTKLKLNIELSKKINLQEFLS